MLVAVAAVMPFMLVVVPMMIAIVEAFARHGDYARRSEHNQSQQAAACGKAFQVFHELSFYGWCPEYPWCRVQNVAKCRWFVWA